MALLFTESFDHYAVAADLSRKWSSSSGATISTLYGRNSTTGARLSLGNSLDRTVSNSSTLVVGGAYTFTSWAATQTLFLGLIDGSTTQCGLSINSTGAIQLYRGVPTTVLGTTANMVSLGATNYIELKLTAHGVSGSYELRVNGISWLSGSGVNTITSANPYSNTVRFLVQNSNGTYNLDDVYILDDTGTTNNNFLGDVRIQCLYPDGAGNYTQLTPNTGLNYAAVDEPALDGDTTYVSSNTPGQRDSYTFQGLSGSASAIYGIHRMALVRKDDAGTRAVRTFYRSGGVDYESADFSVGDSYAYVRDILELNPATGLPWTLTEINNAEFGLKVQA